MSNPTTTKQIILTRRSPEYWCATINHPPLNIFGPDTIPHLNEIITALETAGQANVIVCGSAVERFFLTDYDSLPEIEAPTSRRHGHSGLQPCRICWCA